ncbi:uncharacterized protein LOC141534758 [Cotesia typhae]|uniref:uncharacterized protein LOC141534758 n=1 Tax=Cotesia typhae TaxID=2053667 RepID=UPI003D69142D
MSSDLLELKSSNEDCNNPLLSYSDQTQINRKENAGIFRPWSLLSNISTTFHPITENKSTKELYLEPSVLAKIDTSGDKSNVFESTEKNSNIGSMVAFLKNEVRETDVTFMQMVAEALTRIYESNERYNRQSSKVFEIPEFYTQPGDGMVEIAKNSTIFFPLHVKKRIEMACQGNDDWETIVKSALLEIYGDNISNYSARGTLVNRHRRPKIDDRLYNSIFDWIKEKVGPNIIITSKMYNTTINKLSYNKRANVTIIPKNSSDSHPPDRISEEDLLFCKRIVKVVEESYEIQKRELLPQRQTHEILSKYTEPAKSKMKISPNYEIYLSKGTYAYIERKSEIIKGNYDWKTLVKETLLEVYGDELRNYSAKGTRGDFPGINIELYRALYDWACSINNSVVIPDNDFAEHINILTANKRKGKKIPSTKTS